MRQLRRAAARFYLLAKKIIVKVVPPSISGNLAEPVTSTNLNGRVVVITGSSRGIGFALAQAFAAAGARIVLNGRTESALASAEAALVKSGAAVFSIVADLSTADGAKKLVDLSLSHFGKVDVLINNVAVTGPADKSVWDVTENEWGQVLQLNLMAAVRCTALFAGNAIANDHPLRVLNVSSGIVGHGMTKLGPYAVSKEALEAVSRAYGWDSEDALVSVASIQPRSVRTSMTKDYFGRGEYALLDEPELVCPIFLWAATAPSALVHGRSFSEPVFAADPAGAKAVHGPLAAAQPISILPETFVPGSDAQSMPGAHMHLLENAHGYFPSAADAIASELHSRRIHSYPDPSYLALRQAIAEEAGVEIDAIAVGPGSSELINRILQLFCLPGDSIVMTKPTWSFFIAFAQRLQLSPVRVPMIGTLRKRSLRHDLNGLHSAIGPRARLLYLVNPCNPSGSMLPPVELQSFIASLPEHIVVVLDEAYIQYADPEMRTDVGRLVESCAGRLIVVRTFSKFFGLSGHRVGYAISTPETVKILARGNMPFSISTIAATVVPAVLSDRNFRQTVFDDNARGRQQLSEGLTEMGIDNLPSQTNFILFDCPTNPQRLRDDLRKEGLILPNVDQFLSNYALLAVGKREHNEQVLEALRKY
jgi:histidinol-phosphate aminotransferase